MQLHELALAAALAAAPLQAQHVTDVGLMMDGGMLTVIYGQKCGPFSCQPFQAGTTATNQPYQVYVYGAPLQFFALAIDLPSATPCLPIPGIGNSLLLLNQPVTLTLGLIGPTTAIGVCLQGRSAFTLQFPPGTPTGIQYMLQGVANSASQGVPAFTVAITSTT